MNTKTKIKRHIGEESIEAKIGEVGDDQIKNITDLPLATAKSFWEQLIKPSAKQTMPEQIIGKKMKGTKDIFGSNPTDLGEEGEFMIKSESKEERFIQTAEHQEYFRQMESQEISSIHGEQKIIKDRVQDIMNELKMLAKSSKTMEVIFKQVATEQMPVNPGQYHINFFEWLLVVIKNARRKIDEGASWLAMFSSKKSQKKYWNMAKKHGTTFSLSSERTVATQTS